MIGQASRETGLRPAEQSLGYNGRQSAEHPLPSASGIKDKVLERLGSEPFVAMMQAANLWESDDLTRIRQMNRPRFRAVLLKRQVSSAIMIIVAIGLQDLSEMTFTQDNEASRAAGSHRRALSEPYVSLSAHTAPSLRPFA